MTIATNQRHDARLVSIGESFIAADDLLGGLRDLHRREIIELGRAGEPEALMARRYGVTRAALHRLTLRDGQDSDGVILICEVVS